MVNIGVLVREFLLAQSSVTDLFDGSTNPNGSIYAGSDLPEGFNPARGPGILLSLSGGVPPAEIPQIRIARLHVSACADQEEYAKASGLYAAINDVLHGATNVPLEEGYLLSAIEMQEPQEMSDPDTAWVYVYGFYQIMARPN